MPATLPQALGFLVGVWLALVLLTPLGARGDTPQGPAAHRSGLAAHGSGLAAHGQGLAAHGSGLAADVSGLGRLEGDLFATVNDWRAGRHLVGLARDPALDAVARRHSADMAARGYLSHDTPEGRNPVDRIMAGGLSDFTLAGENVGMTNRAAPNAEIFHGWLASRDHYENLSAPAFNATGIGIARRTDGTLFYTQVYVTFPR